MVNYISGCKQVLLRVDCIVMKNIHLDWCSDHIASNCCSLKYFLFDGGEDQCENTMWKPYCFWKEAKPLETLHWLYKMSKGLNILEIFT